MTEDRKVSANDIISGGQPNPTNPKEKTEQEIPDGKMPAGIHPVVQQRLERERAQQTFQQTDNPQPQEIPEPNAPAINAEGKYVTHEEMQNFVADLNVQLGEISRWLNTLMTDNQTYKNTIMSIQRQMSSINGKVNALHRNQ